MAQILIVEDDSDLRRLLTDILTVQGHQVWRAVDGVHALRVLLDRSPDVLLTDIMMPDMDGLGLLQVLRDAHATNARLKIIAISGAPNQAKFLEAATQMGAHKVLTKPFSNAEVVKAVEAVLTE